MTQPSSDEDLTHEQVIRIAAEVSSGSSWEQRTDQVPDTAEARDMWDRISADIEQAIAKGYTIELPHELAIDEA